MTANAKPPENDGKRILIIDDNPDIHVDYKAVLCCSEEAEDLSALEEDIFGEGLYTAPREHYRIDSALQGQDGLAFVEKALGENEPYALAFVDMRMPPGWDGMETIERIFAVDDEIQIVICTAYTDYTRAQLVERLGMNDRLLFLKKPFDVIEVEQLAGTLRQKWLQQRQLRKLTADACRAKDEIEILAKEQALASKYKAEFVANVSHELFTPLNSIQSLVTILSENGDQNLTDKQLRFLHVIQNSGTQLTETVTDLLAIAQFEVEGGNGDHGCQEVAVKELLYLSTEAFRRRAISKGLEFEVDFSDSLPSDFIYNTTMMFKIFSDLLSNAVKFTEQGGIRVNAWSSRRDQQGIEIATGLGNGSCSPMSAKLVSKTFCWWDHIPADRRFVVIEVRDTGVGISPEQERVIFGDLELVDESIDRNTRNFVLGLHQCTHQLKKCGGTISIISQTGTGSCFRVCLPEYSTGESANSEETAA